VSRCHYWCGNLADNHTGNDIKCRDGITGTLILCITVPISKHHDSITGTVTWPITVPVMIQSVTMALPVR
jgi:hypothetical protein